MDPARQSHGLPDVRRAKFIAMMRAFHFVLLEFKLQLVSIRLSPSGKLKLELQLQMSAHVGGECGGFQRKSEMLSAPGRISFFEHRYTIEDCCVYRPFINTLL